jgi:site-specific DNA recombinase
VNGHRTLIINEQEAAIVRLIFDLYVNKGCGYNSICKYLESLSIPKPGKGKNHQKRNKSKFWNQTAIDKILKNPVYIGRWFYNKRQRVKSKNGKITFIPRPKDEWLLIEVPPIINEEIFKAAQEERAERAKLVNKFHKHNYLLSGMLKCGCCGSSFCGESRGKIQYYRCIVRLKCGRIDYKKCDSPPFRTDMVEAAIWQWVKSILLDENFLREALQDYERQQEEKRRPFLKILENNKTKLTSLEEERSRLIKAYREGVLSLDD